MGGGPAGDLTSPLLGLLLPSPSSCVPRSGSPRGKLMNNPAQARTVTLGWTLGPCLRRLFPRSPTAAYCSPDMGGSFHPPDLIRRVSPPVSTFSSPPGRALPGRTGLSSRRSQSPPSQESLPPPLHKQHHPEQRTRTVLIVSVRFSPRLSPPPDAARSYAPLRATSGVAPSWQWSEPAHCCPTAPGIWPRLPSGWPG